MDPASLAFVTIFILGFGLFSRRLEATVITPPMVFALAGMMAAPDVLGLMGLHVSGAVVHVAAEVTLILVLFGDAARIDLGALRRELGLPVRLLLVGMPLTIAIGTAVALWVFPQLAWAEAAVLAVVLAPTDAALGQAVVSTESVPVRIRQALNVESGLNDGIALPFVVILAALAGGEEAGQGPRGWLAFTSLQLIVGPLIGYTVARVAARVIHYADSAGWVLPDFERLQGIAIAVLAFALSEWAGGNGFIAAFVAGLILGSRERDHCGWLFEFLEAEGQLLMLLVFLLLGASLAWPALGAATPADFFYAVLSLTLVRMVPVALALLGTGLRPRSVLFLGWCGPRGLASVLFAILIVEEANLPHGEEIFRVAILTVLMSIFAHGMTAAPLSRAFARAEHGPHEHLPVTPHPLRIKPSR